MDKTQLKQEIENTMVSLYKTGFVDKLLEFTQGENKVLLYLCSVEEDTDIFPSDISRDLLITRQRVTAIITSLEKKGFVTLNSLKADRRRVVVEITKAGYQNTKQKYLQAEKFFDFFIDEIGIDKLADITASVNDAVKKLDTRED